MAKLNNTRQLLLESVQQLLSNPDRIAILSTVDGKGAPNLAIFGSVQLREDLIVVGVSENRSLKNLRLNPLATMMVLVPGASIFAYQGVRLSLECRAIEGSGELLDEIRAAVSSQAGKAAARLIGFAVSLSVLDSRPLVEMPSLFSDR